MVRNLLLIPMFVLWGMTSVNAQDQECIPSIEIICPAEVTVACDQVGNTDLSGLPSVEVEACGLEYSLNVEYSDALILNTNGHTCVCGPENLAACSYSLTRTWVVTVIGTDLTATCTQVVNVIDNVGPVFSPLEDITVQCIEDVVAPEASATDACSDVTITSFESHTAGVISTCVLTTPIGPGPDGSIWLFEAQSSGNAASDWWSWVGNPTLTVYDDGTAHISGSVQNVANASQAWDVSIWLENRADWTTWSSLGRWYKNDLGLAGSNYLNWDYYELVAGFSNLTGTGAYAGNILYLSHQPSNYFFGWQSGIAANNRNANNGMSGWFFYDGWYNGSWVSGHGDMFTDMECTPNNPQLQCEDEVTFFFRAVDACGNATIESQVVSVEDTIAPEITNCPEGVTVECGDPLPAVFEGLEATDNCDDDVTITYLGEESSTSEDNCTTVVTRTWMAEDDCANRTLCVQEITVVDTTAPSFTFVPGNVTFECDEEIIRGESSATDVCQGDDVEITVEEEIVQGNCPQNYDIVRTFYANDGCGNVATATQVISIVDTTAPVFDAHEEYVAIECDNLDEYVAPTAQDNCGEVTVILEEELLNSGGCLGVLERHYVAYDECGNSSETVVFIALQDNTAPVIENPADFTVECSEVPSQPEVPVTDNCEGEVTVVPSFEIIEGECENAYTIIWTWTATDYCENVSTASTTVTVVDTTSPIFGEVPADATYECSDELPEVVLPIATDNCDDSVEVAHTDMIEPGDCPNEYVIVRMFRAFDNCGNQAMAVQYITVVDTTAPEMEGVAELSFECDEEIVYMEPTAWDNCAENVTITHEDVIYEEGNCYSQYGRIYTATDACGNSSTFTQVVTVRDTTAPVISGDIEISLPCDNYEGVHVEVADNCNEWTIDYVDEHVSGGCQGRIIRTYTAYDACQNSSEFMQIITLTDETAPVVVEQTEDMTIECGDAYDIPVVQWSDNCDDELETDMTFGSEGSCPEVITFTFTAEDNCGNVSTTTVIYTIVDTTAPIVSAPAGGEFSCEETIEYGEASAQDICSEELVYDHSDEIIPGNCPNSYTIVRMWTATDECGNVGSGYTNYYVYDNTAPEFTFVAESVTVECDDEIPGPSAQAVDNCAGDIIIIPSEEIVEGNCPDSYTIIRTYTATDACGNSATAVQHINVVDTTAPVITGTIEIERPCGDYEGTFVEATDNCSDEISFEHTDEHVSGGCQGRIIRIYTAWDACGNSSQFTQFITLTDDIAPVVESQTEDETFECGYEYPQPVVEFSDNCDDELTVETSTEVSDEICPRTITYTFTAEDNCGNITTAQVVYTIVDTTAPVVEAPQGGEFSCDSEVVYGEASASDICSDELTYGFDDEIIEGDCPNSYTIVRTWSATDACGNTGYAATSYYIYDNEAPVFVFVGEDATVECDEEVPAPSYEVIDNCSDEVNVQVYDETYPSTACANAYTLVYTYVATDACGNENVAYQTISVVDTTAPEVIGALEITRPCDDYEGIYVEGIDNCSEQVSITYQDEHVSGGCQGRIIRTYTVVDECDNSTIFTQIITLTDEVAPSIVSQPENATIECGTDYEDPIVTFSDNCDDELTISSSTDVSVETCPQIITYTFTAEDNCGNITTAQVVYTIVDTTAPVWEGQSYTIDVDCSETVTPETPQAYDVCSTPVIEPSVEVISGSCPANYTEVYTYIATDACGNHSEPFVITVNHSDTTAPEWEYIPSSNEYSCEEEFEMEMPVASDDCSAVEVLTEENILEGECPSSYVIERIFTAVDACGNSSGSVSVYYYIYDITAPVIETQLEDLNYDCPVEIVPVEVVATDNCSDVNVDVDVETIYSDECGNGLFRITYLAVDACGNSSEAEYYVSIYDETAPELSETPADLVLDCEDSLPDAPVVTATDNCGGDIEVEFTETIVGDQPAEGSIADCDLITPVRPVNNPCNYSYDWAMALFAMPTAYRYYEVVEGNLVRYEDRIEVTATLANVMDNTSGFYVSVTFTNPKTWEEWSSQAFPTGFKADCGAEGENHEDWIYYLLQAGDGAELVGFGGYAGSAINLVHAPANNYFGFQLGDGANNYNGADNGFGGWFTYNGVFLVNGEPVMSGNAAGAGDFAFELDCCPDYSVVRTWTAMDCTGNAVTHTQTISWAGSGNANGGNGGEDAPATEEVDSNLDIIALFPNPSINSSDVQITSKVDSNVMLDVVDVTGRIVAKLFDGRIEAGQVYKFTLNTSTLTNGLYQVRLISNNEVSTKQLQVVK